MERRAIVVTGVVQGVGFRPFVYHLADRFQLHGSVKNQSGSVLIEVEGEPSSLEGFLAELTDRPPPLAQIDRLSWEPRAPRGESRFQIESSEADGASPVFISPDVATCPECLAEVFDTGDRRFGYPFLNCTNCGPRLTIITGAPYDRRRTTMATFAMCAACRAEYDDPADRRFHAQPTACADCGPRLRLLDGAGMPLSSPDPIAFFGEALEKGEIGALKGLGGYHLACMARDSSTVAELRRRKHRDEKPFAVMVADLEAAERLVEIGPAERSLLLSAARPIVLLRALRPDVVAEEVAPGNPWLGVMLPYTPLHHLLMRAVEGVPLVMTSGNRSDEPIVHRESDAGTLAGIADLFLVHDRPIHVRCDDSVTRVVDGVELPVRRSRGYAPSPIALPVACPRPVLAVGGQLKVTFALGRGRQAFVSHHMGDLDHYNAFQSFENDVELYQRLFAIRPELLVHDLHPDYVTTRYAQERAAREGTQLLAVQHHHAHVASCMAENGLDEPVIGVAFDGSGFGDDGAIWGGEFLVGDYRGVRRAAHLRYIRMAGGDRAVREPWRLALAHLRDAGKEINDIKAHALHADVRVVLRMLERNINAPFTSSVGRLFDAVASLAGVRDRVSFEGQAAIELEALATAQPEGEAYPLDFEPSGGGGGMDGPMVIDTRPMIRAVADDVANHVSSGLIARRFHSTMVDLVALTCGRLRDATQIETVVLSGGVFLNALLTHEVCARLGREEFRVYRHRLVPPNDGGLSLGQLAVAAALLS
ncbi:MAG: carbamoyltransferase HypF [Paludisphaera borealis]|uniref:carbamoyltransferase HypF n=1 Tax=Paludisphaera borealis TaxID=1387353 RepID=UPI002844AC57|nr:carbamoyltransferase HypF [Paludisphaera borealis]MDR3620210.1 carbamoyltransferase HypF [Paludisphaera borealis]